MQPSRGAATPSPFAALRRTWRRLARRRRPRGPRPRRCAPSRSASWPPWSARWPLSERRGSGRGRRIAPSSSAAWRTEWPPLSGSSPPSARGRIGARSLAGSPDRHRGSEVHASPRRRCARAMCLGACRRLPLLSATPAQLREHGDDQGRGGDLVGARARRGGGGGGASAHEHRARSHAHREAGAGRSPPPPSAPSEGAVAQGPRRA